VVGSLLLIAVVLVACTGTPATLPTYELTAPAGWEALEGRRVRIALPSDWAGGAPDANTRQSLELLARPVGGRRYQRPAEQALRILRETPERMLLFAIDIREPGVRYFANVNVVDLRIPEFVPVGDVLERSADHYRRSGFTVHQTTVAAVRGAPSGRIVVDVTFPFGMVRELVYLVPTGEGYRAVTFAERARRFNDRLEEFEDAVQTFETGN
jgi:hypothetical protein